MTIRHFASVLAAFVLFVPELARGQSESALQSVTIPQITALEREKQARPSWQRKVDSQLLYVLAASTSGRASAAAPALRSQLVLGPANVVVVDVQGNITDELVAAVRTMGAKVIAKYPSNGQMRLELPISSIQDLAGRSEVRSIQPKVEGLGHQLTPLVDREGFLAHAVDEVQDIHHLGILGEGVIVGVLSDSIDDGHGSFDRAVAQGILTADVVAVLPGQGGAGSGEGLAMIEIIHAIAPKAKIIFATADGGGGPMTMANNIRELKESGAQIIVDDYTYFAESPFQVSDYSLAGVVGKAVEDVSNGGVLYFSAARNSGNQSHKTSGTWEGDFSDGGVVGAKLGGAVAKGHFNVFEYGVTLNTADDAGSNPRVDLFWADPLGEAANDYDLFVVDRYGHVVASSTSFHDGSQDPYQSVARLSSGQSVVIVKAADSKPLFLHLDIGDGALRHSTTGSVRGHDAVSSANAFTVAAVGAPGSGPFQLGPGDAVESFSSDGPRRIFFNPDGSALTPGIFTSAGGKLLHKPDFAAADNVATSYPKGSPFNPFKGTSAAAPHAAAIAALLLSCKPSPSPAAIRKALQDTAQPIEGEENNDTAGYGVIMANAAAAKVCKPLIP